MKYVKRFWFLIAIPFAALVFVILWAWDDVLSGRMDDERWFPL